MDMVVLQTQRAYIEAETKDAELYRELSKIAQNAEFRQLLLQFSDDEQLHADLFGSIYKKMTGKTYSPEIMKPVFTGSFFDILRERVIDESGDYRKYAEKYIDTQKNEALKDAYYRARTDENVHALRLLYMLSTEGK